MNCKGVHLSDRRISEEEKEKKDLKFHMITFSYHHLCHEKMDISIDAKKTVHLIFF